MPEDIKDNWPAFEIKSWKSIHAFSGRIANEEEAKSGIAVFCLKNTDSNHKAYEIELPKLAYLVDSENNTKELIVAIQAEVTKQGIVVGYRNPNGGNGACFLYELIFLTEKEIEKITK
ncbi:hypothetical protein G4D82_14155 [Flavobacterium sp. CYK-4]|uniref:hypothetical protein n=1 Tax=Flavobacterium lotistagni TaxID=2709660 RepID=UPI00140C5E05|nr:hypothetical protein [Flavobacterium lotistagni]NHM08368.1 hypothetical protein [Flavobacterium lotistagni]